MHLCIFAPMHIYTYAFLHLCILHVCIIAILHFCILVMYHNHVKEKSVSGTSSYTKRAVHHHIRNEWYIVSSGTLLYTRHHIRKERYFARSGTSSYTKSGTSSYTKGAVHHHIQKLEIGVKKKSRMRCTYAFLHLAIFTVNHFCIFAFCMSAFT